MKCKNCIKRIADCWKNAAVEVRASAAYTVCSMIQRSFSFITMPLFTRMLTVEQYGQATVYASWETILSVFISLYLAYGSFQTAMIKFEQDREGYMASANEICTAMGILFLVIYSFFRPFFDRIFELPPFLIAVMTVSIVANNALQCWLAKCRFEFRYMRAVIITVSMTVFSSVLQIVLVIVSQDKGYARILGGAAAAILFGGAVYVWNRARVKICFNRRYWKYALGFNIPLIPYYLSQMIYNHSDRIMISHLLGTGKAAVYGVAYNLAMLLSFVLQSVNSSYMPWIYSRMQDSAGRKNNRKVSAGIAGLMAVLLAGVVSFAPELIGIMAAPEYMEAVYAVPPVAASVLVMFYAQLFINIEFYFEEKKYLVYGTVVSAVVNVILNGMLIPVFGYTAAAYTTLFSYVILTVLHFGMYRMTLSRHGIEDDLYDYRVLSAVMSVFAVVCAVMTMLYTYRLARYAVIFFLLCMCIWKKKMFLGILDFWKTRNGSDLGCMIFKEEQAGAERCRENEE